MADDTTGEAVGVVHDGHPLTDRRLERLRAERDQALHGIGLCLGMLLADFYDPDLAEQWMHMEHIMLGGKTPLAMITSGQTREVLRVIGQLRGGTYT